MKQKLSRLEMQIAREIIGGDVRIAHEPRQKTEAPFNFDLDDCGCSNCTRNRHDECDQCPGGAARAHRFPFPYATIDPFGDLDQLPGPSTVFTTIAWDAGCVSVSDDFAGECDEELDPDLYEWTLTINSLDPGEQTLIYAQTEASPGNCDPITFTYRGVFRWRCRCSNMLFLDEATVSGVRVSDLPCFVCLEPTGTSCGEDAAYQDLAAEWTIQSVSLPDSFYGNHLQFPITLFRSDTYIPFFHFNGIPNPDRWWRSLTILPGADNPTANYLVSWFELWCHTDHDGTPGLQVLVGTHGLSLFGLSFPGPHWNTVLCDGGENFDPNVGGEVCLSPFGGFPPLHDPLYLEPVFT